MKKTIAVVIACLMIVSQIGIYGVTDQEAYAGNQLRTLGILKGYLDGSLGLDRNISRAEVATMTVRILGYENVTVLGKEKQFTDVLKTHWSYHYVQNASKLAVINGYPSGEFKPDNHIAYAEVIAIMVNALGEQTDIEGIWPDNYLNKARSLGIIQTDSKIDPNKIVTRGEMSIIVWNTLLVKD